ncbi:Alpha/beta hydrolase family-domain-containing protein [Dactylonectria macrodidyma]|uniref:Alpha/beta hydrolase family-domain-containing protein n=1 Tax=Dactylonectria macrodidyma TaxID=307937 RepID=A0A9P9JCW0_9HYPO|nr:Alpha/beta hydrolase family-domain-containing protein [Dactylonectria macrodidyma]
MYSVIKLAVAAAALFGHGFAHPGGNPYGNSGDVSTAGEASHVRTFFYVGGAYVDDGSGGHIFRDQMYVEKLVPARGATQKNPVVFIHGQGQTGTNFLNKPDGSRGWASRFIAQGYEVYIVDQTFRGRSAWQPSYGATKPSTYSAEIIQQRFTAVKDYNLWAQASLHTQWPGTGVMGDDYFDAFYSSNIQFINNATYQQTTMQNAGAALLDKIGKPVILVGHSQGGLMPILIADARPALTKALILLEPTGPPFREAVFSTKAGRAWGLTDVALTYSPAVSDPATDLVQATYEARGDDFVECVLQAESPTPRKLVNLASKPILLVTSEASYHMPYDYCTVRFLKQAGCSKAQHLELGEVGIHGNGHMFFMEKNSDKIQSVLQRWISSV